jgi:hypothetical protein
MEAKRPVDIIDWRSERAKEIKKVLNDLKFNFVLISDDRYDLGPYEIIRLVNIFATSRRMKRSLESFEKCIKRSEKMSELDYVIKVTKGKNKNKIRAISRKID